MRRNIVLIASAVITGSTIPAIASECTSNKDIDASRSRWATLYPDSLKTRKIGCAEAIFGFV
jgi:hypothetical protein